MALSLLFPAPARANPAMAHRQGCFRSWKSAAIIDPAHTTTPHAVDGAPDLVRRCIPCRAFAGYPASHGCIRLPSAFAPKFFGSVARGDTVWITRTALPEATSPMTTLAPITPDGQPLLTPAAIEQAEYWNPALTSTIPSSGAAPLSLLASLSQQRLYVLQQGQLLAAAALPAPTLEVALDGGALFEWKAAAENTTGAGQWHAHDANATQGRADLLQHVLPANNPFTQRLSGLLGDGSRLFISHLPAVNDVHWAVER